MNIRNRYLLKEISKVFALFIVGFYFLYVLIDYSVQTKSFNEANIPAQHIIAYYLCHFSHRAQELICFALLLATIKVLCTLNTSRELVALLAGGISRKKILRPFFFVAALCSLFLLWNSQTLLPASLGHLKNIEERYLSDSGSLKPKIQTILLPDHSQLIYQNYDSLTKTFFDIYWVRSLDDIYGMRTLDPHLTHPVGASVDHFTRQKEGDLQLTESWQEKAFTEMKIGPKTLLSAVVPADEQSITQLWSSLPSSPPPFSDPAAATITQFNYKLAMPLIPFIIVMAVAPFCMSFDRSKRLFPIYALGLFGLVTFFTMMNAAVTLGENQIVSPWNTSWAPVLFGLALFSWRYREL